MADFSPVFFFRTAFPALITVAAGFVIHRSFIRFQKQKHLHVLRIDHFKQLANLGNNINTYIRLFNLDLYFRGGLLEEEARLIYLYPESDSAL